MRRKKRFTIRLVALGFAVAAVAAPTAQAMPEGMSGVEVRALQESQHQIVSPDDRAVAHGASYSSYSSPDPPQVSADDGGGLDVGTLGMSGIVLLFASGAALLVVRQARKGRFASA